MRKFVVGIALLVTLLTSSSIVSAQKKSPTLETIFHEPYSFGVRPSFEAFSFDDKKVYFEWNDSSYSVTSLYQVDLDGNNVTKAPKDIDLSFIPSPDNKKRAFTREGDLWIANYDGTNEQRLAYTKDRESNPMWSADSKAIAYQYKNGIWIYYLDGTTREVFQSSGSEKTYQLRGWALGNQAIVASVVDRSELREVYFPEYNGKFVETGATKKGIPAQEIFVAYIDSVRQHKLFEGTFWLDGLTISPSGKTLIADILDPEMKQRQMHRYDLVNSGDGDILYEEKTKGWINSGYVTLRWAPAAEKYVFTSEESGYNHLYLMSEKAEIAQLTQGEFEIAWWQWKDDNTIIYASNEGDTGLRDVYEYDLKKMASKKLTDSKAYRTDFALSHSKRYVVYMRSEVNMPAELYLLDTKRNKGEVRLTNSVPDAFSSLRLLQPTHETIVGRDGITKISMMMLAEDEDNSQKPVVVFVHGAGSLQNVFKGWSDSYPREYLFNQMLAQNGYVVLEVDFRHSLGYGRKFREDVTGWMGKYETHDIQDGLARIAATTGADTSRVGIYGGSYGGFMALYAVSHAPESFDAAAALRAVTNWENYYHANPWYTLPRLGKPDRDKDNYLRSSPLFFASQMDKPVLILHGLEDNNVGFQDAVQYIERLIQSGKDDFEMMMYPTERHSFKDPDAWFDEYRRIYRFWEKWLKEKK